MHKVGCLMLWTVLALVCVSLGPWAMKALCRRFRALDLLGSVFLCYAAGLVLSFFFSAVKADMSLITTLYSVFVMLAIPLILFSADLGALKRLARPMLISFCLGTAAVLSEVNWLTVGSAALLAGLLSLLTSLGGLPEVTA